MRGGGEKEEENDDVEFSTAFFSLWRCSSIVCSLVPPPPPPPPLSPKNSNNNNHHHILLLHILLLHSHSQYHPPRHGDRDGEGDDRLEEDMHDGAGRALSTFAKHAATAARLRWAWGWCGEGRVWMKGCSKGGLDLCWSLPAAI